MQGRRDPEGENTARRIEQVAPSIVNVVSAQAIQISPDIQVANVLQRVSGVTLERGTNGDGRYAIVRGMDKRYNYTLVNGIKIPSPDPYNRYVPLDIFPADLLQRLEVTKALTPSMEGDAIGGVVNMVMKDAPAERTLSGQLGTGYGQLLLDRSLLSFDRGAINKESPAERNGSDYQAKTSDFPWATFTRKTALPNLLGNLTFRQPLRQRPAPGRAAGRLVPGPNPRLQRLFLRNGHHPGQLPRAAHPARAGVLDAPGAPGFERQARLPPRRPQHAALLRCVYATQ